MSNSSPHSELKPLKARLAELKREADELLVKYGIPMQPPPAEPVIQVRLRLLQDHTLEGAEGTERTLQAGAELVADKALADRYVEGGLAEVVGPAAPRPAPKRRPYGEGTAPPYFEWFFEIADRRQPSDWRNLGIEMPAEEKRLGVLAVLWNAALVHTANVDIRFLEQVQFRERHGCGTLSTETALLWLMETLLLRQGDFPASDAIRALEATQSARRAGGAAKFARGIQAAVNEVYREGMTEEACWEALETVDQQVLTADGTQYQFYVDRKEDEVTAACQTDDRTGRERSIKRSSFRPYFTRARGASRTG